MLVILSEARYSRMRVRVKGDKWGGVTYVLSVRSKVGCGLGWKE